MRLTFDYSFFSFPYNLDYGCMWRDNSDSERIDFNATTREAQKTSTSDSIILKAEIVKIT